MTFDPSTWNLIAAAASPLLVIAFLAFLAEVFDIRLHWTITCLMMLILAGCLVML